MFVFAFYYLLNRNLHKTNKQEIEKKVFFFILWDEGDSKTDLGESES